MSEDRLKFRDLLPAIAISVFAAVVGVIGYMQPPEEGEMAVIFPPWTSHNVVVQTIVQSGAQLVSPSRLPNVFVVQVQSEDHKRSLYEHGAWFFAAATGLCGPLEQAIPVMEIVK